MRYMLMLMLVLGCVLPGGAGQKEDALLNGLLELGARALESRQAPASPAADGEPAASAQEEPSLVSLSQGITGTVRQALGGVVEEYKQEGRAYAREVGDVVVQRVVQDPEIHSGITSVRIFCWVVVAYLSLVTLLMLTCLVYLRQANARLLARVEELVGRTGR